jgi:glycosyltransferase involved in cell wall biosynthesis
MKIVVCGTRGFPNVQGGIETHCEELYPRVALQGQDITVVRRSGYVSDNLSSYRGVTFKDIRVPKISGVESALHTLISAFYARKVRADILHIHGIGPAIVVPIAKLLGLKVVVTHHGPDYEREKWGHFARFVLRMGEYFTAKFADEIIVISSCIADILGKKYDRTQHVRLIYNGVNLPDQTSFSDCRYLEKLGLTPGKYVLAVGRFVKEKNFGNLIDAFQQLEEAGSYRLVIAGDSDIETAYSRNLKFKAKEKKVVLTGMIKGKELGELYSHAALFVLPSSHEGLPITLLEAMSYNRKVVVSRIPANLAVKLDADSYFQWDDRSDLTKKISAQLKKENVERTYDLSLYNWDTIALDTIRVYELTLHPVAPPTDMCIVVTYRCPVHCKMYNIGENPTIKNKEITPEEIKRLPKVKFINITGGEPFVRDDLDKIIEVCFTKSPRVVISTSGWYDDKLIALAQKFPHIGIRINIEGLAGKNDELRGRPGEFEKELRTLRKLREMGIRDVGFVITNKEEVCGNSEKLIKLKLKETHPKSRFRAFFNMGLINYIEGNKRLLPCKAGLVNFFVDPNGDVYLCNGLEEKYWKETMGNIRETPDFQTIWESRQAENIRRMVRGRPQKRWMEGTASPVMKKYLKTPLVGSVKNKIRSLL